MQPDIIPLAYCNALHELLDHVNPVPFDAIAEVIRQETGLMPEELFERFEREPLASGSIGQVHVAHLNGKKLAVKVQRPSAQASFDRDIELMTLLVWLVRILRLRALSFLIDPLSEFAAWTRDELDFRREAHEMCVLRRSAEGSRRQYVPFVVSEYTSRRLLVIEFLEGVTLLDHLRALYRSDPAHQARLDGMRFDPETVARNVIDNCLGDVFRLGVFHADLHPANVMILHNNIIGYVDFGITGHLSRYSRQHLLAMTLAYARKDVDALCNHFFDVSSFDRTSDPVAFREGVKRLSEQWYSGESDDARLKTTTTQVMLDMARLSRETHIIPQRDVVKYIRTSIAIDGLVRRFAPGFDFARYLGTACRRHLTWHARRMLVSHDALVDGAKAGVELVRNGVFRVAAALQHISEVSGARELERLPERTGAVQAWPLVLMLLVSLGLIACTQNAIAIGPNLATAELLVAVGAAAKLVGTWRAKRAGLRSRVLRS
jgi:ubiquinone biosynthesis protein